MTPAILAGGGPLPPLARSLPFAVYIAFLVLDPWLATVLPGLPGLSGFDPRWLYVLRIGAVLGVLVFFRRTYGELFSARAARGDWALAVLLGLGVFLLWIALDSGWTVTNAPAAGFVPLAADGSLLWPLIALRIFGAAAVVPLMEELFWRSFIQRWIDRPDFLALLPSAGSWRALCFTSLLFGFEHGQWLAGIIAGLVYGWLYRRSDSLWPPIAAHALTNFLLGVWVVKNGAWQFW